MREQDLFRAVPLFFRGRHLVGLQFPLSKVGNSIDDDPGYTASKIHNLRNHEHTKCREKLSSELTSCNKKLANPVAITGFPIHMYQLAHCVSIQLSCVKSVLAYKREAVGVESGRVMFMTVRRREP